VANANSRIPGLRHTKHPGLYQLHAPAEEGRHPGIGGRKDIKPLSNASFGHLFLEFCTCKPKSRLQIRFSKSLIDYWFIVLNETYTFQKMLLGNRPSSCSTKFSL